MTANTVIPPILWFWGCLKVVKTITADEHTKWIGHGHEEYLKLLEEVLETEAQS